MLAVIQRVKAAAITTGEKVIARIGRGLLIFLGVLKGDSCADAQYLARRISGLRIFNDRNRKMNLSVKDIDAQLLVVSQFTLCANLSTSGRRPSFDQAEEPERAERLYLEFIQSLRSAQLKVEQGRFGDYMTVHIENDGPVTFILSSRKE